MLSSDSTDRAAHTCWEMLQLRGQSMIQWTHLEALTLTLKKYINFTHLLLQEVGFCGWVLLIIQNNTLYYSK